MEVLERQLEEPTRFYHPFLMEFRGNGGGAPVHSTKHYFILILSLQSLRVRPPPRSHSQVIFRLQFVLEKRHVFLFHFCVCYSACIVSRHLSGDSESVNW